MVHVDDRDAGSLDYNLLADFQLALCNKFVREHYLALPIVEDFFVIL